MAVGGAKYWRAGYDDRAAWRVRAVRAVAPSKMHSGNNLQPLGGVIRLEFPRTNYSRFGPANAFRLSLLFPPLPLYPSRS